MSEAKKRTMKKKRQRFGMQSADATWYGVYFFVPRLGEDEWSRVFIRADGIRSPSSLIAVGVDSHRFALSLAGKRNLWLEYHPFERGSARLFDVAWIARLTPGESGYLVWSLQWWTGSNKDSWPESVIETVQQTERLLSSFEDGHQPMSEGNA